MSQPVRAWIAAAIVSSCVAAGTAHAQAPAGAGVVTAVGQASAEPVPRDRTSNASVARAVAHAQGKALPLAVAAARARAQALAASAGLTLGALTGITDGAPPPYYGYGHEGTFGPGRYCGTVPRYRTTRLAGGRVRRTRIGSRRTCRIPRFVVVAVTATFTAAPAG